MHVLTSGQQPSDWVPHKPGMIAFVHIWCIETTGVANVGLCGLFLLVVGWQWRQHRQHLLKSKPNTYQYNIVLFLVWYGLFKTHHPPKKEAHQLFLLWILWISTGFEKMLEFSMLIDLHGCSIVILKWATLRLAFRNSVVLRAMWLFLTVRLHFEMMWCDVAWCRYGEESLTTHMKQAVLKFKGNVPSGSRSRVGLVGNSFLHD